MAYNDDVFEEANVIREDLPKIRQNFAAIATAFGKDHTPLNTEGDTLGNHRVVRFISVNAHPTDSSDDFYVLEDANNVKQLYVRFGSISNLDPIRLASSDSSRTGSIVVNTSNNSGTLTGDINYFDRDGIRRYWGLGSTESYAGFRVNGRTVVLPQSHSTVIGFGATYYNTTTPPSVSFTNDDVGAGIAVDFVQIATNGTIILRGKVRPQSGTRAEVAWWIEVVNETG